MLTYDPETDESFVFDVRRDEYKRQYAIHDYGDAYFVDQLIHQMGYDKVFDEISYKKQRYLICNDCYHVISNDVNCYDNT